MSGVFVLAVVFVLMLVGVAVPFALGGGAIVAIATMVNTNTALNIFGIRIAELGNNYTFLAIAFFVFYGRILEEMDARTAVVNLIAQGRPGRAVVAEAVASLVVPDISGEALLNRTETAAVSTNRLSLAGVPLATALRVSALLSIVRAIAPPTILVVILGLLMEVSIAQLWIPLLVMASTLAVLAVVLGMTPNRQDAPTLEPDKTVRGGLVWLFMAVFVPWALFAGIVTPTEIAALSAVLGVVIALIGLAFGWVTAQELLRAASRTLRDMGNIFLTLTFGALIVYAFVIGGQLQLQATEVAATFPASTVIVLVTALTIVIASLIGPFAAIVILAPLLGPSLMMLGTIGAQGMREPLMAATFGIAAMLGMLFGPFGTAFVTLSAGSTMSPVRIALSFALALLIAYALGLGLLALTA